MAKTNRPLKVLVHPSLWDLPAVVDLREKQNTVVQMKEEFNTVWAQQQGSGAGFDPFNYVNYDLILSPTAWRIVPGMEGQIETAIKAARRVKYGKKESETDES